MADNGNDIKFNAQNLWAMFIVAALGGLGGGIGWRQVDPTAFTAADAQMYEDRLRQLEIKVSQLPPSRLLIAVDRLDQRMIRIEAKINELVVWDREHYKQDHRNQSQSHGR